MNTSYSAGGIILHDNKIALIQQKNKTWSFPKGHIEEGENALQAAIREIKEETGLTKIKLIKKIGTYIRPQMGKKGTNTSSMKQITLFLFTTNESILKPEAKQAHAARWVLPEDVCRLLSHPTDKEFYKLNFSKIFK